MSTKSELEKKLKDLRREYDGTFSLLAMMEKGTKLEDLVKLRKEKLDPIREEIARLEKDLLQLGPI